LGFAFVFAHLKVKVFQPCFGLTKSHCIWRTKGNQNLVAASTGCELLLFSIITLKNQFSYDPLF